MPRVQAPKGGVKVGGKFYKGGRFLPGAKGGSQVFWNGRPMMRAFNDIMFERCLKTARFLRGRVRRNIGKRVVRTGFRVKRSKPGEFPRRDTGELWKTLDALAIRQGKDRVIGTVSSPLGYARILEGPLNRSFLARTFNQSRASVRKRMSAPITENKK